MKHKVGYREERVNGKVGKDSRPGFFNARPFPDFICRPRARVQKAFRRITDVFPAQTWINPESFNRN
jgi:hypothetical protein